MDFQNILKFRNLIFQSSKIKNYAKKIKSSKFLGQNKRSFHLVEYQNVTFDLIHKLLLGDSIAAASVFSKLLPDNLPDRKYCGITVYVSLKLKPCAWPALVQWDLLQNPSDRLKRFQEMISIILEMEENRIKVNNQTSA